MHAIAGLTFLATKTVNRWVASWSLALRSKEAIVHAALLIFPVFMKWRQVNDFSLFRLFRIIIVFLAHAVLDAINLYGWVDWKSIILATCHIMEICSSFAPASFPMMHIRVMTGLWFFILNYLNVAYLWSHCPIFGYFLFILLLLWLFYPWDTSTHIFSISFILPLFSIIFNISFFHYF